MRVVRRAWGSGRWFPGDADELRALVEGYLEAAGPQGVTGRIVAAIAPHAGYVYSGKVAGHTFRAIRDAAAAGAAPDTVVILGLSHRGGGPGVAFMDGDAIQTPLGVTALDQDALRTLTTASERLRADYGPHAGEHSAENEIPFVQVALPDAELVVALIGDHDAQTRADMVEVLGALSREKKILVVASTDLLHDADYDRVTRTDRETLERIAAVDYESMEKDWSPLHQTCCGIGPVTVAMQFAALQGCDRGHVLHYRNSGDDFPESRGQWVVGYGAVVFAVTD